MNAMIKRIKGWSRPLTLCLTTLGSSSVLSAIASASSAAPFPTKEEEIPQSGLTLGQVLLDSSDDQPLERHDRLVGLGASHVSATFDAIADHRCAVLDESEKPKWVKLSDSDDLHLMRALKALPSDSVRRQLHRVGLEEPNLGQRRTIVRLLKGVGLAPDLPLLVELSEPLEGRRRPDKSTLAHFSLALSGILERTSSIPDNVIDVFVEAHPSLVAPIVRGLAGQGSREALGSLASMLGLIPEADALLLLEIGRVAQRLPAPHDVSTRRSVRRYLDSSEIEMQLAAADVAGRLEDREAISALIGMLGHRVPAVGQQADEALQLMTKQDLGADLARWDKWYTKTMEWWREEAPELISKAQHGRPGEAARALNELARWRVFRHDLVDTITDCVGRKESEIVLLSCAVLGHLGSWKAIPTLVERLDDPDQKVQAESIRALQRITGRNHRTVQPWIELARELPSSR